MEWDIVIGIETHVQLNTKTKLFCGCRRHFGDSPNVNTCPVCLGHPGVLPVFNIEARNKAVMAGLSLNCSINKVSQFDRKNYFYPDSPKAYQITQLEKPICLGGYVDIMTGEKKDKKKRININRIHIEEDAGKLVHSSDGVSYVDLNRAGTPLIEVVSEADIHSADEAISYMQNLRSTFLYAGVSDCNMEEGNFRGDINISIKPKGSEKLGNRTEVKNMNSFKAIHAAILSEYKRQKKVLESGGKIITETLLFDIETNKTRSMRSKEEAHDYRYFPDPDLLPSEISEEEIEEIRKLVPELPEQKIKRYIDELKLSEYDAGVLVNNKDLGAYYDLALKSFSEEPKKMCNWIMVEVNGYLNENNIDIVDFTLPAENIGLLFKEIKSGAINGKIAKEIFPDMIKTGKLPSEIISEKGLTQVTDDGFINEIIDKIIADNESVVTQYREGNQKVFGFFVGSVMKESKGKANPKIVNDLLRAKLDK